MGTANDLDLEKWMMEVEQEEEDAEDVLVTGLKSRPPRTSPQTTTAPRPTEENDVVLVAEPQVAQPEGEERKKLHPENSIYFDAKDGAPRTPKPPAEAAVAPPPEPEEEKVPLTVNKEPVAVNGDTILENEPQGANGGLSIESETERSIYFDTRDGTANGSGGKKYGVFGDSVTEKKLENGESDFTPKGINIPKSPKINDASLKDLTDDEQSGLHLNSSQNGNASPSHVDDPHRTPPKESEIEVAEWDVERVLDKQDTHDLYCPNCNSCITKRVILRKRKRQIQKIHYDLKREKLEAVPPSSLATNNESHSTTLPVNDGCPPLVDTSDQDHETGLEIFRCLSCFSFFIPSVARFKLFRIFGGRGEHEESLQTVPVRTEAAKQGGEESTHRDEEVSQGLESQYPPNHQSGHVSSVTHMLNEFHIQPVNTTPLEPQGARNDFLLSSSTSATMVLDQLEEVAQKSVECQDDRKDFSVSSTSVTVQIVKNDVEESPHGALQKNIEGGENDMHRNVDIAQGLESQYPPNNQRGQLLSVTPVPNEFLNQPVNSALLEPQDDRNDFLLSSSTSGMLVHDHAEDVAQKLKPEHQFNHQSNRFSPLMPADNKFQTQSVNSAAVECQDDRKDFAVASTSATVQKVRNDVKEPPHGTLQKNLEDEMNAAFSSISRDSQLPVVSHANEQVNVSTTTTTTTTNVWNDEQNGQHSSTSVSIHHIESRTETDGEHKNTSRRTEGGYVMQDQSSSGLLSPLPNSDKDHPHASSEFLSSTPGTPLPGVPNRELVQDSRLISFENGKSISFMSKPQNVWPQDKYIGIGKDLEDLPVSTDAGKDVILLIEEQTSQSVQSNIDSSTPETFTYGETEYGGGQQVDAARTSIKWDILKSTVYGGLVESIASLGVVSSAAGGDATTLNIVAMGLAYLVGGLFIIGHNLLDLRNEEYGAAPDDHRSLDRYQELLGKRRNFKLHATIAVLSYLIFGLVAPLTYGFSFYKSGNKEYKLIAVGVVSLLCIFLLAMAKAYVRRPPKAYINTLLYFMSIGVMSSGVSYVVGMLIQRLLEKVGWFEPSVVNPVSLGSTFVEPGWSAF